MRVAESRVDDPNDTVSVQDVSRWHARWREHLGDGLSGIEQDVEGHRVVVEKSANAGFVVDGDCQYDDLVMVTDRL